MEYELIDTLRTLNPGYPVVSRGRLKYYPIFYILSDVLLECHHSFVPFSVLYGFIATQTMELENNKKKNKIFRRRIINRH